MSLSDQASLAPGQSWFGGFALRGKLHSNRGNTTAAAGLECWTMPPSNSAPRGQREIFLMNKLVVSAFALIFTASMMAFAQAPSSSGSDQSGSTAGQSNPTPSDQSGMRGQSGNTAGQSSDQSGMSGQSGNTAGQSSGSAGDQSGMSSGSSGQSSMGSQSSTDQSTTSDQSNGKRHKKHHKNSNPDSTNGAGGNNSVQGNGNGSTSNPQPQAFGNEFRAVPLTALSIAAVGSLSAWRIVTLAGPRGGAG